VVPDFNRLAAKGYGYGPPALEALNGQDHEVPAISHKDVILSHHPFSVVAEAYRMLRSTLLLSRAGEPARTILLTSATRGEGKSTTLVNTAIVFAQMGARVLIIDADLRRPRCHRLLDVESGAGLTEVLAGHVAPEQAVHPTPAENLFVITSGASAPNSAELLGSKKMADTLSRLLEQFDYVFIDSSPVLAVSDAVLLATMVEGVVLVVDGQKTPKQLVRDARSRLNNPKTKILGALLNRVDARNGAYAAYYSHYYQYYGGDQGEA
jgi:capsular exopolysaccharide synthesis family protein